MEKRVWLIGAITFLLVLALELFTPINTIVGYAIAGDPAILGHSSDQIDFSSGATISGGQLIVRGSTASEASGLALGHTGASGYGYIQSYNQRPLYINRAGNDVVIGGGSKNVTLRGDTYVDGILKVDGNIYTSARTLYLQGATKDQYQGVLFSGDGTGGGHGLIRWKGADKQFTIGTGNSVDTFGAYGDANLVVTGSICTDEGVCLGDSTTATNIAPGTYNWNTDNTRTVNVDSATTASSVAWSGVTGKPASSTSVCRISYENCEWETDCMWVQSGDLETGADRTISRADDNWGACQCSSGKVATAAAEDYAGGFGSYVWLNQRCCTPVVTCTF